MFDDMIDRYFRLLELRMVKFERQLRESFHELSIKRYGNYPLAEYKVLCQFRISSNVSDRLTLRLENQIITKSCNLLCQLQKSDELYGTPLSTSSPAYLYITELYELVSGKKDHLLYEPDEELGESIRILMKISEGRAIDVLDHATRHYSIPWGLDISEQDYLLILKKLGLLHKFKTTEKSIADFAKDCIRINTELDRY
jgi:hypothetical protein